MKGLIILSTYHYCAVCPYVDDLEFQFSGSCRFCVPEEQCGCNMKDWDDDRITEHCEKWFTERTKVIRQYEDLLISADFDDGLPF